MSTFPDENLVSEPTLATCDDCSDLFWLAVSMLTMGGGMLVYGKRTP